MCHLEPSIEPVIRRVILRTRNVERLAEFYHKVLGVLPQQKRPSDGLLTLVHPESGATLLTLIEDSQATEADPGAPGLFHVAFLLEELDGWKTVMLRALRSGGPFYGAADRLVSWAGYLSDPDGNGVELAWDTPKSQWPWRGDQIEMVSDALPLRSLLENADPACSPGPFGIGHLHLQVGDLAVAAVYRAQLDLSVTQANYPGAHFLARDGYHHHLAVNVWRTRPGIVRAASMTGLVGWEMARGTGETAAPVGLWLDPYGHEVQLC